MSITLDNSDFQYLQDQLVELKNKNYELAEKNRRGQADFEAAKAKICSLQLKLEEQERDFQITSTTLRREIEVVASSGGGAAADKENGDKDNDNYNYKIKYKKVLLKAKELQTRYEKSAEIVQQLEQDNAKLLEELRSRETQYEARLQEAIDEVKASVSVSTDESESLDSAIKERDILKSKLESQAEERKIYEKKGMQVVRELKRQLTQERNRADTLQERLEDLLSQPPPTPPSSDTEGSKDRLSTTSSTNGNSNGSNLDGGRANQEISSVGSWSFVPPKCTLSNVALNETMSLCSIDSEDRETVQQPRDAGSEDSMQRNASITNETSRQDKLSSNSDKTQSESPAPSIHSSLSAAAQNSTGSSQFTNEAVLLEEQAALVDRLTKMQHEKWQLEEKLSYLEQANSALSEDLANKSHVIRNYFLNQAVKAVQVDMGALSSRDHVSSRRTSFPSNINHLLSEKPSLKKVVDFLRERGPTSMGAEAESLSKEAARKMQIMLEETLIKCIKLQENLDDVTNELNKLKN